MMMMLMIYIWPWRPGFNPKSPYQELKIMIDAALVDTQHNKVRIKGKGKQCRDWSNAIPYTSV